MNALSVLFENVDLSMSAGTSGGGEIPGPSRASLAAKLQSEGIKKGEVLYKPSDAFTGFLRIVENNIFFHLLEILDYQATASVSGDDRRAIERGTRETEFFSMTDVGAKSDSCSPIYICAYELLSSAEKISDQDDYQLSINDKTKMNTRTDERRVIEKLDRLDFVYINRPVACIRACVRLIAMKHPQGPSGLLDVLDDLFKKVSKIHPQSNYFHTTLERLRNYLSSLHEASREGSWGFVSFRDDPYANVLHFSKRYFLRASPNINETLSYFEIKLINCGDLGVKGDYTRVDEHSEDPTYKNRGDFSIIRRRQTINEEVEKDREEHVFIWYIVHLKRSTAYYSCATADSSTLPPSLGWRVIDAGVHPAPTIIISLSSKRVKDANAAVSSENTKMMKSTDDISSLEARQEEGGSPLGNDIILAEQYDGRLASGHNFNSLPMKRATADSDDGISTDVEYRDGFESIGTVGGELEQGAGTGGAFRRVYSFEVSDSYLPVVDSESGEKESTTVVSNNDKEREETSARSPLPRELVNDSSMLITGLIAKYDSILNQHKAYMNDKRRQHQDQDYTKVLSSAKEGVVSDAFREKWNFEHVLRTHTAKKFHDASIDFKELQYSIQEAMLPESQDFKAYAPTVKLLGMRLARHDEIKAGNAVRRFRYVSRISIKAGTVVDGSVDEDIDDDDEIGLGFAAESIKESDSSVGFTGEHEIVEDAERDFPEVMAGLLQSIDKSDRVVYTLAYDLGELCNLHAALSNVLLASDIHPPSFPDPFAVEALEERLFAGIFRGSDDPDTFVYNHEWLLSIHPDRPLASLIRHYDAVHEDASLAQATIACLEGYLTDTLTLIEEILSNDGSSYEVTKDALVEILRRFFRIPASNNTGGLTMKLVTEPVLPPAAVKQSEEGEEDLLRRQKFLCAGCGEPLRTSLFQALNLEKSYAYCGHSSSLFCKRWCHFDSTLPIPKRVLEAFDLTPMRVSELSLDYLKMVWRKPMVQIDVLNPALSNSVTILLHLREKRRQAITYLREFKTTDVTKHRLSHLIADTIGFRHSYLFMNDSVYSMEDLVSIHDGKIFVKVNDFVTALARSCESTM